MARHGLSDEAWDLIKTLLPDEDEPRQARPWVSHREVIDGILWILRTGAPWRDLPEEFPAWETVYGRFRRWTRDGTWQAIFARLQQQLGREGSLDMELWCVDGTVVRAARCAAGATKKSCGRTGGPRPGPLARRF